MLGDSVSLLQTFLGIMKQFFPQMKNVLNLVNIESE